LNIAKLSLTVLYNPVYTFHYIKENRGKTDYRYSLIILFLIVVVRIAYIYMVSFTLGDVNARDSNLVIESAKMLIPVLSWILACFAVTTILDGETLLGENLMSASLSMMPYIVFSIPLALVSNILNFEGADFYNFLKIAMWLWIFLLLLGSTKIMNGYTLGKTIKICILAIISAVLLWAAILLMFVLTGQIYRFVQQLAVEIKMLLFELGG